MFIVCIVCILSWQSIIVISLNNSRNSGPKLHCGNVHWNALLDVVFECQVWLPLSVFRLHFLSPISESLLKKIPKCQMLLYSQLIRRITLWVMPSEREYQWYPKSQHVLESLMTALLWALIMFLSWFVVLSWYQTKYQSYFGILGSLGKPCIISRKIWNCLLIDVKSQWEDNSYPTNTPCVNT